MSSGAPFPVRRVPQQDRSRAMVERILAAGREDLLERGYERASTSRIAAKAGISPGSLYQYFPHKEAILDRVIDRYTEELQRRITDAFVANLKSLEASESVHGTIRALLDALEADAGMLRVIYGRIPRTADPRRVDFVRRVDDLVTTALLFRHHPTARPDAVDATAWILVRTIESVTVSYVLDPPRISRASVIEELSRLIESYLAGPSTVTR